MHPPKPAALIHCEKNPSIARTGNKEGKFHSAAVLFFFFSLCYQLFATFVATFCHIHSAKDAGGEGQEMSDCTRVVAIFTKAAKVAL